MTVQELQLSLLVISSLNMTSAIFLHVTLYETTPKNPYTPKWRETVQKDVPLFSLYDEYHLMTDLHLNKND